MKIFRFIFVVSLFFSGAATLAQPVIIKSTDNSDFPRIRLKFYDRNPEEKKVAGYGLLENAVKIKYELQKLNDSVLVGKDVLILFENSYWPEYSPQRDFFKDLLREVLPGSVKKEDHFYLATFDWTSESDGKVMRLIESKGKNNSDELLSLIDSIKSPPTGTRLHHSTELFQAMSEGIQFLSAKRGNNAPAILVLSAEFSNIHNLKYDDEEVISDARKADIPIYSLRYQREAGKYNIKRVCNATYGIHADVFKDSLEEATNKARNILEVINRRCNGILYELSFQTSVKPDGAAHEVELLISGDESTKFTFQAPGLNFWLKKYPWLWGVAGLLLLASFFSVFIFFRKRAKIRAFDKKQTEDKLDRIRQENADAVIKKENDFDRILKENAEAEVQKLKKIKEQVEFERRLNRLRHLIRFPSLTDISGNRFFIETPDFLIGRDASECQLHINDSTVSRLHAIISFEKGPPLVQAQRDGKFFIWDNGSTNGTFINGQRLTSKEEPGFLAAELHSGDHIKFGNIQFTFHL